MFNKSYRSLYLREQDEIDKREELIQSNEPLITSWIHGIGLLKVELRWRQTPEEREEGGR